MFRLVEFNVSLVQCWRLLQTVWNTFLRIMRRHVMEILIHHGLKIQSYFCVPRGIIWMETWSICTQDWLCKHQVPLSCIAVSCRRASNPDSPIRNWVLYQLDHRSLFKFLECINTYIGEQTENRIWIYPYH